MHRAIQTRIEEIYRIRTEVDVDAFVVARSAAAAVDAWAGALLPRDEQLLVVSGEDTVEMALVFDDTVLDRLREVAALGWPQCARELSLFCLAAEGVSHLLYAAWSAQQSRVVRAVELELQAEVDKFVLLTLARPASAAVARAWIRALFERFDLCSDLSPEEERRYRDANRLARRYCVFLVEEFVRWGRQEAMLEELRRFYRSGADKLPMAEAA